MEMVYPRFTTGKTRSHKPATQREGPVPNVTHQYYSSIPPLAQTYDCIEDFL